jgi:hypothetical protein
MPTTNPAEELATIVEALAIDDSTTKSVLAALLRNLYLHYPGGAVRRRHEPNAAVLARLPMALGSNPIRLTQVYQQPGHECYVTFFLGPLIGYELTFRVATPLPPPHPLSLPELLAQRRQAAPARDFVNLLANLANHTLFTGQRFDKQPYMVHHLAGWFGNGVAALLLLPDPVLGSVGTEAGPVRYIHALGISQASYEYLTDGQSEGPDQQKAADFVAEQVLTNPYLATCDE